MVMLTVYNTEDVKTSGGGSNFHVPDGDYKIVFLYSGMEPSPFSGKPDDLVYHGVIIDGQYKDKEFEHRLAVNDQTPIGSDKPEWTWSKAAYGFIGQMSACFGLSQTPSDSSFFHNKPMLCTFTTKKGIDKETKQHKPEWDRSFVKKYSPLPQVGISGQPSFSNAAATPVSASSGTTNPPWKR